MSFLQLGLDPKLCDDIEVLGYKQPTPIQQQVIPHILNRRDVLASAQTGTGKTASFLLSLIHNLSNTAVKAKLARAVIVEPTRELALQVMENFTSFVKSIKLKAALLVGGESMFEQQKILSRGVDVLIATPGRLLDLIDRNQIILASMQCIVIDEADRMLDMGFIQDIKYIMSILPKNKQTVLLSATFPDEIKTLSDHYLNLPINISIDTTNKTAETIQQFIIKADPEDKRHALDYVLSQYCNEKQGIVFCNRKKDIGDLVKYLQKHGHSASALHGELSQSARSETVKRFKDDDFKILVASDVAARGLDVDSLNLVVNFDVPNNCEDYVHRIGRTGRAGQNGVAISFLTNQDNKKWQSIEKLIEQNIEEIQWQKPKEVVTVKKKATYNLSKTKESNLLPENVIGFGNFTPAFMLRDLGIINKTTKAQTHEILH